MLQRTWYQEKEPPFHERDGGEGLGYRVGEMLERKERIKEKIQ
jgi:hypothetical protein